MSNKKLIERFFMTVDMTGNSIVNVKLHPVTTIERLELGNLLSEKDAGMTVYDLDLKSLCVWNGDSWDIQLKFIQE